MKFSFPKLPDIKQESVTDRFVRRLRAYFFTGILITAPIAITLYLTFMFVSMVDQSVAHLLPANARESLNTQSLVPGIGLLIASTFFIIVGWFATNILGRFFIRVSEYILARTPFISTLYNGTKQIFEMLMGGQSKAFREPVMLQYPRLGMWTIGFVTGRIEGEVQGVSEDELISVFVPTTPNPTSGFLYFVPRKDLVFLQMGVEDAMKLVLSAGMLTPGEKEKK